MDVGAGIERVGDGEALDLPLFDGLHERKGLGLPVEEGGIGCHHHGVHQVAVQFGHPGESGEIARKDRPAAAFEAAGSVLDAGFLKGAGGCRAHPGFGAGGLMPFAQDGDAVRQLPVIGGRKGGGIRLAGTRVGAPLDKAARH